MAGGASPSVLPVGGPADKPEEEDDDEDEEEAAAAVDGAVMVALPSGTSSSLPSSSLSTSSSSLLDMTILSRDWITSMGVAAGSMRAAGAATSGFRNLVSPPVADIRELDEITSASEVLVVGAC